MILVYFNRHATFGLIGYFNRNKIARPLHRCILIYSMYEEHAWIYDVAYNYKEIGMCLDLKCK